MLNYFGKVDWEIFYGVIIVRCLQTYTSALQDWKSEMTETGLGKNMIASWAPLGLQAWPGVRLARAESVQTAAFHANSSLTKWGKTKQNGQKVEAPLSEFSMS